MSTNPMPPPIPMPPGGSDPNKPDPRMPDLVDPAADEDQEVSTPPDDDSPLSQPVSEPRESDDNPDDQLPHWESFTQP
jgi:hypothetical protein